MGNGYHQDIEILVMLKNKSFFTELKSKAGSNPSHYPPTTNAHAFLGHAGGHAERNPFRAQGRLHSIHCSWGLCNSEANWLAYSRACTATSGHGDRRWDIRDLAIRSCVSAQPGGAFSPPFSAGGLRFREALKHEAVTPGSSAGGIRLSAIRHHVEDNLGYASSRRGDRRLASKLSSCKYSRV